MDFTDAQHEIKDAVQRLQERCDALLKELEDFQHHLVSQRKEDKVECKQFTSQIRVEAKALAKMASGDMDEVRVSRAVSSSNLPYFEALWAAAKRSNDLVAMHKRFYWDSPPRKQRANKQNASTEGDKKPPRRKSKGRSALVDIVTENGAEWIKVSTITQSRLLSEMAKQGWWERNSFSDSDEEVEASKPNESGSDSGDEDTVVSIVKMAEDLSRASKATRIRYQNPRVNLVLPKLTTGGIPDIETLLNEIRTNTGVTLHLADEIIPSQPLSLVLSNLEINEFKNFTSTLNIDCTILLALVSDLSHTPVPLREDLHRAVRRQIEMEEEDSLLLNSLYPAMSSRKLVCTAEAAQRMREIVDTIGTPSEQARTKILMGDSQKTGEDAVAAIQELSSHDVPRYWNLPIEVVEAEYSVDELPHQATKIAEQLSEINRSVFFYGWAKGITTISSNRTVAKTLAASIEEFRDGDEGLRGPDVWLCSMARSLVGKEKRRR